jgi:hypothetical protein
MFKVLNVIVAQFARDYSDNPDFAFAQHIVNARKIVFSKTLQNTKWAETELARRPLVEEVKALKAEPGRGMIAFGGASFASALIANQFYVNPVVAKRGELDERRLSEGALLHLARSNLRYSPRDRK